MSGTIDDKIFIQIEQNLYISDVIWVEDYKKHRLLEKICKYFRFLRNRRYENHNSNTLLCLYDIIKLFWGNSS